MVPGQVLNGPFTGCWAAAITVLLCLGTSSFAAEKNDDGPPSSPLTAQQALRHFHLPPGLRIELAAAEPQVVDPVEARFDEDGRLWVVEMRDYPSGPAKGRPPRSRIRVLEDRDGDGYFEHARTFADKLVFPTGLQPWRGGVIVTLAGRIVYMKDTDGDGRADRRDVWFTGFAEQNTQLRANHPRLGPDFHVHVANGLRGGAVVDRRRSATRPLSISGRDFRFDPLGTELEAVSGHGQFGLAFDRFGRRFVCSNRNPLMHVVIEDRYARRNPLLALPAVGHDVAAAGGQSRVYPLSRAWTTSTLHAGQFTAACGVFIYEEEALGAPYRGNAFICEPTGNLVHREVLTPAGATFTSRPPREGAEFLATRDTWFRPVNLTSGPDGALYVVDMVRAVIEHPQWMPAELQTRRDLRDGDDRGRIWRIVDEKHAGRIATPRLSTATGEQLAAMFDQSSTWRRETAARLLVERSEKLNKQDKTLTAALEKVVRTAQRPAARARALACLAALGGLSDGVLAAALVDPHARARENAVWLAEPRLKNSAGLRRRVIALAGDDDPRVRFQVALSLGELPGEEGEVVSPLVSISLAGADDPWTRRAVMTAAAGREVALAGELIKRVSQSQARPASGALEAVREAASLVGARGQQGEIRKIVSRIAPGNSPSDNNVGTLVSRHVLLGLSEGAARRGITLTDVVVKLPDADRPLKQVVHDAFALAAKQALDRGQSFPQRETAIALLRWSPADVAVKPLLALARDPSAGAIQVTALDALSAHRDASIGPALLAGFRAQTPAVRRAVLDVLVSDTSRASLLLDSVEQGKLRPADIDPVRTRRLVRHGDASIRRRAEKLLAFVPAQRKQVLAEYDAALRLDGDATRGRTVFTRHCATCHRVAEIGVDVGPDIADSRTRTPEQLLTDILDPNRAIDAAYLSYTAVTAAGKVHSGVIAAETTTSITLRQAEGKTLTLLRRDLDELAGDGVSMMPVGLEKDIPPPAMADLIAFIKNWRYLDGRIPLGDDP